MILVKNGSKSRAATQFMFFWGRDYSKMFKVYAATLLRRKISVHSSSNSVCRWLIRPSIDISEPARVEPGAAGLKKQAARHFVPGEHVNIIKAP